MTVQLLKLLTGLTLLNYSYTMALAGFKLGDFVAFT